MLEGRGYVSAAAMKFLSTPQTGKLPTGFFQNETYGNRGTNYVGASAPVFFAHRTKAWPKCFRPAATDMAANGARKRGLIASKSSPTS